MRFDPKKLNALAVRLHGRQIGVIYRLNGERQLFAFEQDYIDDPQRPTLSLSFKSSTGGLVTYARPVSRRVPPFLANLLPEGYLRTYLAKLAGVNPEREFFLLAVLGADLPGALVVTPLEGDEHEGDAHGAEAGLTPGPDDPARFRVPDHHSPLNLRIGKTTPGRDHAPIRADRQTVQASLEPMQSPPAVSGHRIR